MQTETHYMEQIAGRTAHKVIRKAGNVQVGTVKQLYRGWEADHGAGVRLVFGSRIEAFNSIADADNAAGKQGYRAGDFK